MAVVQPISKKSTPMIIGRSLFKVTKSSMAELFGVVTSENASDDATIRWFTDRSKECFFLVKLL